MPREQKYYWWTFSILEQKESKLCYKDEFYGFLTKKITKKMMQEMATKLKLLPKFTIVNSMYLGGPMTKAEFED